ncbi:MAG: zinc ABC transporter substrate-binding protein [Actinomycetota bacterium]|nr:zinc ABC transporter substrate-binding protein [Actinomycetota bacterium]
MNIRRRHAAQGPQMAGDVRGLALVAAVSVVALLAGGCSTSKKASFTSSKGKLQVVAAENFWGSIATQLAGDRAEVRSIITNPNTDPHDYEPTAADGRSIASAKFVIVNGIGYDAWASKAVAANPSSGRDVLNVGDLTGHREGDNPHRWYFPEDVHKVVKTITAGFKKLDPADAGYFDQQERHFEDVALKRYNALIAQIRTKYARTPVGASESIFVGIAEATGLVLKTPASFLKAISEGTDVTATDKSTVDNQVAKSQIKVFVFNSQNSTPDVQRLVNAAKAKGIPVATITETLTPAGATFEDWQAGQLQQLLNALAKAVGKR